VIELLVGADGERRRLLLMETGRARHVAPGLLQLYPLTHHFDHVDAGQQVIDEALGYLTGHARYHLLQTGQADHGRGGPQRKNKRPPAGGRLASFRRQPMQNASTTPSYGSIEPFETLALTLELLGVTLDRSGRLALALCGRLLVVLATAHFGENAGFFAGTLEATQRDVKRLVITYFDRRH
jgi:hypothetical protein